ncbi:MAG TPA: ABC transporter substrate-binding protein [Bryobacteraceae bacterium]|nr:ABC transporter substrate-binding protein [Bryobacteraceae bacterium]
MKRLLVVFATTAASLLGQWGGDLRFCLRSDPKTFNPLLVEDEASETVRYLTGGVLIRVNRLTQELEPELATSWKISRQGRAIAFQLRRGVSFSDGTPFTADDVAYTMHTLMDPALHSPTGDSFRSAPGDVETTVQAPDRVTIVFPAPVAGLERLFDQVAIVSSRSPKKEAATLGPFAVSHYTPGTGVVLERNPHYWKTDASGHHLPYLDAIHLDIQQNREIELVRFTRGELHLINTIDPEMFSRLAKQEPSLVHDAGPSLESEMMWLNQNPAAPLPDYEKAWFRSQNFRRAISAAINRADICRVVYHGHAQPAAGPISPANRFWFDAALKPHPFDPKGAMSRLQRDGFRMENGVLRDRDGHAVEFSLITNSGNKAREHMAAMMQQDLAAIGIKLNIVTLDFRSLIERISQSFRYEACLLGLTNYDLDPSSQMNVWLSSASNHQWYPNQKTPDTAWEAEIDRLMQAQAATVIPEKRKAYFDKVQAIVSDQAPFLYLVTKNSLSAVSPKLQNVQPAMIRPQTYWNAENLTLAPAQVARNAR